MTGRGGPIYICDLGLQKDVGPGARIRTGLGKSRPDHPPGQGSPPPKAGMQPVNDLTALKLNRLLWKMRTQVGTDVCGSPVRSGTVASSSGKGTKLSWDRKRGGWSDDTFDSGLGTLHSHGTGPTPRTQPGPGPVDPQRVIPARGAQWQSDVHELRMSSPARSNLVPDSLRIRRN